MGQYIINGEVIDVPGDRPTAGDLKTSAQAVSSDWVMATMRNGEVVSLADDAKLPHDAEHFHFVPQFQYGRSTVNGSERSA